MVNKNKRSTFKRKKITLLCNKKQNKIILANLKKLWRFGYKIWKKINKRKLLKMRENFIINEYILKPKINVILRQIKLAKLRNQLSSRWALDACKVIINIWHIDKAWAPILKDEVFLLDVCFLIEYLNKVRSFNVIFIKYYLLDEPSNCYSENNQNHTNFIKLVCNPSFRLKHWIERIARENYFNKHANSMKLKNPLIFNYLLYYKELYNMPIKDLIAWIYFVDISISYEDVLKLNDKKGLKLFYWLKRFHGELDIDWLILLFIKILRIIIYNNDNKNKYKPSNAAFI